MLVYDEMVAGAVDLHCHVDVEFSQSLFRKREPEWEWLPRAERAGIEGYVLKSHLWPTVTVLPLLRELYGGPVGVFGSVTLNKTCGGLDLWSVEAAAAMGARVVFLPTWGSANDRARGGFNRRLDAAFETFDANRLCDLTVVDEQNHLLDETRELIRFCRDNELILATGHIGWQESLAVSEEAERVGLDRVVFSHPLSNSVGAPVEAMCRAAELGSMVEVCWTNIAPGRHDPADVVGTIRRVGVENVVVTTDYFLGNNPAPPELLRLLLGVLYDAGLTFEEVRTVASVNPKNLLGF